MRRRKIDWITISKRITFCFFRNCISSFITQLPQYSSHLFLSKILDQGNHLACTIFLTIQTYSPIKDWGPCIVTRFTNMQFHITTTVCFEIRHSTLIISTFHSHRLLKKEHSQHPPTYLRMGQNSRSRVSYSHGIHDGRYVQTKIAKFLRRWNFRQSLYPLRHPRPVLVRRIIAHCWLRHFRHRSRFLHWRWWQYGKFLLLTLGRDFSIRHEPIRKVFCIPICSGSIALLLLLTLFGLCCCSLFVVG
mmetsp:Transcript_28704/g.48899  ORF Transcript_28704/g.48899 Transcript_28704/m.48899 type:complete len:247 (-) Transcript_28704:592-1332(-)